MQLETQIADSRFRIRSHSAFEDFVQIVDQGRPATFNAHTGSETTLISIECLSREGRSVASWRVGLALMNPHWWLYANTHSPSVVFVGDNDIIVIDIESGEELARETLCAPILACIPTLSQSHILIVYDIGVIIMEYNGKTALHRSTEQIENWDFVGDNLRVTYWDGQIENIVIPSG